MKACVECGGATTSREAQPRCRACWRARGADVPEAEKQILCKRCGVTPINYRNKSTARGFCRPCWDANRGEVEGAIQAQESPAAVDDAIRKILKQGAKPLDEIGHLIGQTPGQALDILLAMRGRGVNLHELNGRWSLERIPTSLTTERTFEYRSRPDNTYVFGVASDQHLCSRYAREDVLTDLYDRFAAAGVDRVFNAGNWIDGEDEKNRFDLAVHGFEPQINYLVEHYPQRPGITTYAVWGEDHEGWYARREAIDVGRFAESQMRQAKREDWVDLGFIEARVDLTNANTGVTAPLVVQHPGGGSSYAYSYRAQKIIESMSGGEKPAVLIIGHYHKLSCNTIRNVWAIQAGTTMDQSVFMRKKGLEAHVGGLIVTLEQDPETGAIFRCVPDQYLYFDRKYYNDRWSKTGPVVQAPRFRGGVAAVGA